MMVESTQRRWKRIHWIDIVLVVIGVMVLLMLTMELSMRISAPSRTTGQ
jgi:hypothetical protein